MNPETYIIAGFLISTASRIAAKVIWMHLKPRLKREPQIKPRLYRVGDPYP